MLPEINVAAIDPDMEAFKRERQEAKASENAMQEDRAWTLWPVVALLGYGYRHRPGYREEWAPAD